MRRFVILGSLAVLMLCGAMGCGPYAPEGTEKEMAYNASNQTRLVNAQPPPELTFSLERQNLIKRYETWNKPDKVSWVTLVSYGKVMASFAIKGKVSSVSSHLTCDQQLVGYGGGGNGTIPIEAPEPDGSYGTNGEAIFFYTITGGYVEWKGEYMISDQPIELSTPPQIVASIDLDKRR